MPRTVARRGRAAAEPRGDGHGGHGREGHDGRRAEGLHGCSSRVPVDPGPMRVVDGGGRRRQRTQSASNVVHAFFRSPPGVLAAAGSVPRPCPCAGCPAPCATGAAWCVVRVAASAHWLSDPPASPIPSGGSKSRPPGFDRELGGKSFAHVVVHITHCIAQTLKKELIGQTLGPRCAHSPALIAPRAGIQWSAHSREPHVPS